MEYFRAAWHSGAPRTRAATDCGAPLPAAGAVSSLQNMVEWVGHHAQDAPHGGQRMVRDLQARVRRGAGQPGTLLPVPGLLVMGVISLAARPWIGTEASLSRIFLPARKRHDCSRHRPHEFWCLCAVPRGQRRWCAGEHGEGRACSAVSVEMQSGRVVLRWARCGCLECKHPTAGRRARCDCLESKHPAGARQARCDCRRASILLRLRLAAALYTRVADECGLGLG